MAKKRVSKFGLSRRGVLQAGAGAAALPLFHIREVGAAGTFLWIDPDAGLACALLTDREFGDWAKDAWPAFSDSVVREQRAD